MKRQHTIGDTTHGIDTYLRKQQMELTHTSQEEFEILLLAYKCLHGTAPSYLREMLKEYVPTRTLRSTSKNLLYEPRTNMKTYDDRSFSACAPKL